MKNNLAIIGLFLILALGMVHASGWGQSATGPQYFNVSLNHSVSNSGFVLVNNNTYNVSFFIDVPHLNANEPRIIVSPLNGIIPAKSSGGSPYVSYPIEVTVYMPLNATLNKTWTLYVTAYGVVNNTGGTATNIGTAKRLVIFSEPSTTLSTISSTSVSSSSTIDLAPTLPQYYGNQKTDNNLILLIIWILSVIAVVVVLIYNNKKKGEKNKKIIINNNDTNSGK